MSDETQTIDIEMRYAGRRVSGDGKIVYAFQRAGGDLGFFRKPLVSGAPIGALYRFRGDPADEGRSVYSDKTGPRRPVLVNTDHDKAVVSQWQVSDRAAQIIIDERRRAAKAKAAPIAALEPIRREYMAAGNNRDRAAILAAAIAYITNRR